MKAIALIISLVVTVLGLGLTVHSWYSAYAENRIVAGSAYAGPFCIVVGIWRAFAAAAAVAPPSIFRMVAVAIGVAAGFGNLTAVKMIFPQAIVAPTTHNE